MKSEFLIYCDRQVHNEERKIIRIFTISTASGKGEIGVHPIGRDSDGKAVEVLLIDDKPIQRNFDDQRFGQLVKQKRTRIRHSFECDCGYKVVVLHPKFLEKLTKNFNDGVSEISLTSLNM